MSTLASYTSAWANTSANGQARLDTTQIIKRNLEKVDARYLKPIERQINEGIGWFSFFGHSSPQTWEIETAPAASYGNTIALPLILSFGCRTGAFALGDASTHTFSLAEEFVIGAETGAIAHWGSSELSTISAGGYLGNQVHDLVMADTMRVLGDVFRTAKGRLAAFTTGGSNAKNLLQYGLIGDPATRLQLPTRPNLVLAERAIQVSPERPSLSDSVLTLDARLDNWGSGVFRLALCASSPLHPRRTIADRDQARRSLRRQHERSILASPYRTQGRSTQRGSLDRQRERHRRIDGNRQHYDFFLRRLHTHAGVEYPFQRRVLWSPTRSQRDASDLGAGHGKSRFSSGHDAHVFLPSTPIDDAKPDAHRSVRTAAAAARPAVLLALPRRNRRVQPVDRTVVPLCSFAGPRRLGTSETDRYVGREYTKLRQRLAEHRRNVCLTIVRARQRLATRKHRCRRSVVRNVDTWLGICCHRRRDRAGEVCSLSSHVQYASKPGRSIPDEQSPCHSAAG